MMSRSDPSSDLFPDGVKGRELKEAGMALVRSHNVTWEDRADSLVQEFLNTKTDDDIFNLEHFRYWAAGKLPKPKHPGAWGGWWNAVAKTGAIMKVEQWINAKRPTSHSRPIQMWKKG